MLRVSRLRRLYETRMTRLWTTTAAPASVDLVIALRGTALCRVHEITQPPPTRSCDYFRQRAVETSIFWRSGNEFPTNSGHLEGTYCLIRCSGGERDTNSEHQQLCRRGIACTGPGFDVKALYRNPIPSLGWRPSRRLRPRRSNRR